MEERTARKWYWWLWLSPLVVTLTRSAFSAFFVLVGPNITDDYRTLGTVANALATVGASIWHLILLVPALNKQSAFVRWHGRQMLLLDGLRMVVSLAFALGFSAVPFPATPFLIIIWLVSTLIGHLQAAQGKCSLMGTAFWQSLPRGAYEYALLLGVESLLVLGWGIWRRSRGHVLAGVLALIANAIAQIGPAFVEMSRWIQIGVVGAILLGGGLAALFKRAEILQARQRLTEE